MRSVFVHFPHSAEFAARNWLDANATCSGDSTWLSPISGETVLWISLSTDHSDWEPSDVAEVRDVLGEQGVFLQVDVSGRVPGKTEVYNFVIGLLSEVQSAVATDDYTAHPWRLSELVQRTEIHGHPFFDYDGWYAEGTG